MSKITFKQGDLVVPLFEEEFKVLKVLEFKNNVVTAETEHGFEMSHMINYRHATEEDIRGIQ